MPSKPDIVLVLADDMGFSDIGCYGGEVHTPNLDRLSESGVRMTQFYNTARCSPSRASLLTGLHPHQTGIGILNYDDSRRLLGHVERFVRDAGRGAAASRVRHLSVRQVAHVQRVAHPVRILADPSRLRPVLRNAGRCRQLLPAGDAHPRRARHRARGVAGRFLLHRRDFG